MTKELTLPTVGSVEPTYQDLDRRLAEVERVLSATTDLGILREWRAQAEGLAGYLQAKDLRRRATIALRRIEARIGQLLAGGGEGRSITVELETSRLFPNVRDRTEFMYLAKAYSPDVILTEDDWALSRHRLVARIRSLLGELTPARDRRLNADPRGLRDAVSRLVAIAETAAEAAKREAVFVGKRELSELLEIISQAEIKLIELRETLRGVVTPGPEERDNE